MVESSRYWGKIALIWIVNHSPQKLWHISKISSLIINHQHVDKSPTQEASAICTVWYGWQTGEWMGILMGDLSNLNKANLRDLIAATGLVILLKLDSNHRLLSPCDLEIWRMTLQNNRAALLCYFKLCASFHTHWWFQISVTVRKHSIRVKIDNFLSRVTLKFDGWPSKTIGHLFYATSNFVQHFIAIVELKLELQSGNAQSGSNSMIFSAVWPWNLTDDLEKQ